jgi:hypothetical protein
MQAGENSSGQIGHIGFTHKFHAGIFLWNN